MFKLKSIVSHKYFFVSVILYYGVFYILMGEKYPFKAGFSTDGRVYESLVFSFQESYYFDSYYIHRILPSFIIRSFFNLFSISFTEPNILFAFQLLNILSLAVCSFFLKKIFTALKISLKNQLLFFFLLVLSFGVSKYHFYFPSMTDQLALMLSTLLLYFYMKNNIIGISATAIALAFTWPMAYYLGLILLAIPFGTLPYSPASSLQKKILYSFFILYILLFSVIIVFILNIDIKVDFVSKIDRGILAFALCLAGVATIYFFFAKLFLNKTFLDIPLFIKKIDYKRLIIAGSVFIIVYFIIKALQPKPTFLYSISQTLIDPVLYSFIKPLITIVADVSYFGVFICLLILFWNSFCKTVSQFGWGITLAIAFNLFLFGLAPQSRHLINLFPWFVVLLAKAMDKYSFSNNFYIVTAVLSFVASKVWLPLNIYENFTTAAMKDSNGNLGFPDQILWMNIGPWMNEQMYYVQGFFALAITGILFFTLYKIEKDDSNRLRLIRKFSIK